MPGKALLTLSLAMILSLSGCASNPFISHAVPDVPSSSREVINGMSAHDADLIALIAEISTGQNRMLRGITIACGETFHAASGRACKRIQLMDETAPTQLQSRLACQDGDTWFIARDVFSNETRGN